MDFHADNEAVDADKHIRFSLLYFADDEMQRYIRTPGVRLPAQSYFQLNLLPVCLASSIAHVPGFVSSLSLHERKQQAAERAAANKEKDRARKATPVGKEKARAWAATPANKEKTRARQSTAEYNEKRRLRDQKLRDQKKRISGKSRKSRAGLKTPGKSRASGKD